MAMKRRRWQRRRRRKWSSVKHVVDRKLGRRRRRLQRLKFTGNTVKVKMMLPSCSGSGDPQWRVAAMVLMLMLLVLMLLVLMLLMLMLLVLMLLVLMLFVAANW